MFETLKRWDTELFIYLNQLGNEKFDFFWVTITQIETWTFLFISFIFVIFKFYKKKEAIWISIFTIVTFLITLGLKFGTKAIIQRIRPNNIPELSTVIRVLQFPLDFSFFSGHAAVSFAVTFFLVLSLRKFTKYVYFFFIWPLLFSYSRIYVGVHFPSDILVGACIGFFLGFGMYFIQSRIKK